MKFRALLPLALVLGCQTRVVTAPAYSSEAIAAVATPKRAWELVEQGRVVGVVVEFETSGGRRFFSVRNAWEQELGLVDAVGRAWRYRPHEREAEWLGSGTLTDGAAQVLGVRGRAELFEVRLEQLLDEGRSIAAVGPELE